MNLEVKMSVCEICAGYGYTQRDDGPRGMPQAVPCECTIEKALKAQADKAWRGLSVYPVKPSVLSGKLDTSLVVTGFQTDFLLHLRGALAERSRPHEFVKIVSDADCLSAWLGSAKLAGEEMADPDFQHDLNVFSLQALAEPCHLLVVLLGVKVARNSAMSEVLHETIRIRQFLNKPIWLVQEPNKLLEEGHLAWSRAVEAALEGWSRVNLTGVKNAPRMTTTTTTASTLGTAQPSHPSLPAPRHKTMRFQ